MSPPPRRRLSGPAPRPVPLPPGHPPAVAALPAPSSREGKLCPSPPAAAAAAGARVPSSPHNFPHDPPRTSVLLSAVLSTAIFCQGSASCARGIFPAGFPQPPRSAYPTPRRGRRGRRAGRGTPRLALAAAAAALHCGDCCPLPPSVRPSVRRSVGRSLLPPPPRCQAEPLVRPPPGPARPAAPGPASAHNMAAPLLPARLNGACASPPPGGDTAAPALQRPQVPGRGR